MQDARPPFDPRIQQEDPEETTGSGGWESLAEITGGLPPDQVEALAAVHELEAVYPLLHALVGRSPRDFFVRAAVMEALVESARPAFSTEDLDEILYWLAEPARSTTLRVLRQSGWLEFDAAVGHTLTDAGRWVGDVLSFFHRRLRENELLPTVEGVRYALDIGLDPLRHLQSMRSRLSALRREIDDALASHSEVVLRRTAVRLREVLRLSERIRAVLDAPRAAQRSGATSRSSPQRFLPRPCGRCSMPENGPSRRRSWVPRRRCRWSRGNSLVFRVVGYQLVASSAWTGIRPLVPIV